MNIFQHFASLAFFAIALGAAPLARAQNAAEVDTLALLVDTVAADSLALPYADSLTLDDAVWQALDSLPNYADLPDNALLPITRSQAEVLIAQLISTARAPYVEAARRDSLLLAYKLDALKRRQLDLALERSYTAPYEARIAKLESALYALLATQPAANATHIQQFLQAQPLPPVGQAALPPATAQSVNSAASLAANSAPLALRSSESAPGSRQTVPASPATLPLQAHAASAPTAPALPLRPDLRVESVPLAKSVVFFPHNTAMLTPEAQRVLNDVAAWMHNAPYSVAVRGYASPEGNMAYNNRLSAKRTDAVVAYLVERGVPLARLRAVPSGIDSMKDKAQTYSQARRVELLPIVY